jgi:hypothetical protein
LRGLIPSDVAAWNIAIQESSATQASLLTNLSPLCGYHLCVFKTKPATNFDRNNGGLVWNGMTVGFNFFKLDFDNAFILSNIIRVLYSYTYWSVKVLFILTYSIYGNWLLASTVYLAIICIAIRSFSGFSDMGWMVLFIQAGMSIDGLAID